MGLSDSAGGPRIFSTSGGQFSKDVPGRRYLHFVERTNYPLTISVDDFGEGFRMVVQVRAPIDPGRIAGHMQEALASLPSLWKSRPTNRSKS